MSVKRLFGVCLVALALLGCGSGGDNNGNGGGGVTPARQFGVNEAELFDTVSHVTGIVVGPGSGLVTLQLEPPAGPPAPLVGDTAVVALDEMWFDVDQKGSVSLTLTDQNLARVSRMEILDVNGLLLLWADAAQRQATGQLEPGCYRLRLRAAPAATAATQVWVWFGGSPPPGASPGDLARLATGNCVNCNLYGADLTAYNLRGANLTGSDMRHALIASVPGGFLLAGSDIMTIYIGGSGTGGANGAGTGGADLSGANLTGAKLDSAILTGAGNGAANFAGANVSGVSMADTYLSHALLNGVSLAGANLSRSVLTYAALRGANLSGTDLRDADLTGADLTGANVSGANFTGARLGGATWVGSHVCAPDSIGACR